MDRTGSPDMGRVTDKYKEKPDNTGSASAVVSDLLRAPLAQVAQCRARS
jgi:hypothetical protein